MGLHDRNRAEVADGWIRSASSGVVSPEAQTGAASVHRTNRRTHGRRAATEQRAVVSGLRRRRAHRGRGRPLGGRSSATGAVPRTMGRARPSRPSRNRGRARRASHDHATDRSGGLALRGRPRRVDARSAAAGRGRRVGRRVARQSRVGLTGTGGAARRIRRPTADLSGRSARLAPVPRLGGSRRLPRARHGARQDTDGARAPRPHVRGWNRVGDRAGRGRRQLAGRGSEVHARITCRRAPRRIPNIGRGTRGRSRGRRHPDHYLRHRRTRRRRAGEVVVAARDPRRGPSHQEPRRPRPVSSCDGSRLARASRSPVRRSRTVSAISGRSSTTAIPTWSVRGQRSSRSSRAKARRPCVR